VVYKNPSCIFIFLFILESFPWFVCSGPDWHSGQFTVPAGTQQIYVEGVRGTGFWGDIGLDDFTFTSGDCQRK
jgi:hypothetical protein